VRDPMTAGIRAVACALATGVATAVSGQAPNLRVQVPGVAGVVLLDSIARKFVVQAPVPVLLAAIDSAFADFGLPVDALDRTAGTLPNRRVTLSRRLGNTPLSRYLDCGRGFSGENANIYRVTLAAAAWPDQQSGTATALHVALIAGGQDPAGSRSGYVLCTSKGAFEEEFANKIKARLAPPGW
jgi:hypothetical protein